MLPIVFSFVQKPVQPVKTILGYVPCALMAQRRLIIHAVVYLDRSLLTIQMATHVCRLLHVMQHAPPVSSLWIQLRAQVVISTPIYDLTSSHLSVIVLRGMVPVLILRFAYLLLWHVPMNAIAVTKADNVYLANREQN